MDGPTPPTPVTLGESKALNALKLPKTWVAGGLEPTWRRSAEDKTTTLGERLALPFEHARCGIPRSAFTD